MLGGWMQQMVWKSSGRNNGWSGAAHSGRPLVRAANSSSTNRACFIAQAAVVGCACEDVLNVVLQPSEKVTQGSKPEENPASPVPPTSDAKPGSKAGSSTNQNRNYAVIAGAIVAASAVGWYLLSKPKKTEEESK
ncbi:hypothetical protein KSP39_PZI020881 [Platanthera zijinensis]|uniref:Uncharacterized protein n=1 Tax=Platanthera zijinensis TaxID=2320716 RepID=A0AAP0B0H7_9ASPA